VNGMILDHKDRQDTERRSQVEGWKKVFVSVLLVTVSVGMLFYIYLFAMRQSKSRQDAWFSSFQVWLFFEIFISSTGLVLVEHVLIPLWSMKDLRRVKEKMVSDLLIFQRRLKYSTDRQGQSQSHGAGAAGCVFGEGIRRQLNLNTRERKEYIVVSPTSLLFLPHPLRPPLPPLPPPCLHSRLPPPPSPPLLPLFVSEEQQP
jgi:hypothetical protein